MDHKKEGWQKYDEIYSHNAYLKNISKFINNLVFLNKPLELEQGEIFHQAKKQNEIIVTEALTSYNGE